MENGDFQEEDIWVVVKERKGFSDNSVVNKRKLATAPKVIPRAKTTSVHQQSSAPVNIPDWTKIYNKKSSRLLRNGSLDNDDNAESNGCHYENLDIIEDEECDYGDGMVPPHEYIARRIARSQIAPFSMCEGVGRTLKGRDLSKLRNAILTQTGFLE